MLQMTAHVLESLEEKDAAAFAAACESLWGHDAPSASSDDTDLVTPSKSGEVSHAWILDNVNAPL